jgi:phage terminase small subunit
MNPRAARVGRPPSPTALKVLNGSAAHDPQRLSRSEPKPKLGAVPPPWLPATGPARKAWKRLEPVLSGMRVLTEADAEALALGCVALADFLEARADTEGWRRADAAWKRYLAVLSAFGLTPSSRARVSVAVPSVKDATQAWLEGSG